MDDRGASLTQTKCAHMPRYFFNVEDDRTIIDQEGTDLPNLRAAREEAVSTSAELLRTLKPASVHGPKDVTMATSVASRPRAIRMRPILGLLCRASNGYQRAPREGSKHG